LNGCSRGKLNNSIARTLCARVCKPFFDSTKSNDERILTEVRMEAIISTEDLKAKLDRRDPVKVVETLAPERYREAHLPGALNIPPEQIKELAPQLLPNKDAEIITYCTSLH
jgi:3-mercaptopyruvate sulfurtransferase SseA